MRRITATFLLLLLFGASSVAKKDKSAQGEALLLQLEAEFAADVTEFLS